jgi:hypothetical protein
MDGSNFAFTTLGSQPWRLHVAASADSSGAVLNQHLSLVQTSGAGYTVAVRPLDASIAVDAALSPTIAPPSNSASAWDPLSGLVGRSNHNDGDSGGSHSVVYDANIHQINRAGTAQIDARYQAAIAAMLQVQAPASHIDIVLSARKRPTIRSTIKTHCLVATSQGLTRRGIVSPGFNEVSSTAGAIAASDPGVGGMRNERIDYSWPGAITSIPQAVGFNIAGADGSVVTDGTIDTTGDGWLAAIESNLPPENNPGQIAPPVDEVLSPILGYARGTPLLGIQDYTAMKAAGVAGLFNDPDVGWQIESGITTSLIAAEVPIARARMADFIEDSINVALKPYTKLNQTTLLVETEFSLIVGFLESLKSPNNPAAQRIIDYSVFTDLTNEASGVTQFNINVQLLNSQNNLVLQTNIGMGVVITKAVSSQ